MSDASDAARSLPTAARVRGPRRRADRARGDARACASTCTSPSPTGREIYTIALSTQIHIDPARRAYDDETRERLVELFGAAASAGARRRTRSSGRASTRSCPRSPARPRSRSRCRAPTTSRSPRPSTSTRSRDGDGAAELPLQRHGALRRRGRPAAGRARAVELLGARGAMPVDVWRRTIAAALPRRRLDPAAARHARRRSRARKARARAAHRSTTRCATCSRSGGGMSALLDRRRAPALHAALRGLRALPVHAGRDQERHADAVRDRLPAGLRGRRAAHVRARADAARARAGGAGRAGRGHASPSSSPAASATRASSAGSSSGRCRWTS